MPGVYVAAQKLFSRLNLFCAILGAALLFFIAAIVVLEVVSRATTGSSRLWVIEVSEYSLFFITFLGAPYLLEKNRHVTLDLIYERLSQRPRRVVQSLNALIGLLVCSILTVVGIQVVIDQFDIGVRQVTVMRPLSWWITAALPLGMFLMAVQFLDQIVQTLRGKVL